MAGDTDTLSVELAEGIYITLLTSLSTFVQRCCLSSLNCFLWPVISPQTCSCHRGYRSQSSKSFLDTLFSLGAFHVHIRCTYL